MKERTDQEWVRQLKQNNPDCIKALWEMLFQFADRAAKQRQAPPDMAHDAAIAAYNRIRQRGINQYKYACPFPGYCRVIVVRELLRLYRTIPPPTSEISEENVAVIGQIDPSPSIALGDVQKRLQPCIDKLPQNIRNVIELLYYKNFDPERAAQELNIRRNYVNQLAHRARKQLRNCLEGLGYLTAGDVFSL